MKKRVLATVLATVLMASTVLSGCGSDGQKETNAGSEDRKKIRERAIPHRRTLPKHRRKKGKHRQRRQFLTTRSLPWRSMTWHPIIRVFSPDGMERF